MSYSVKRLTKAEVYDAAPGQPAEVGLATVLNSLPSTQEVVSVCLHNDGGMTLVTHYVAPVVKGPSK